MKFDTRFITPSSERPPRKPRTAEWWRGFSWGLRVGLVVALVVAFW